MIARTRRLFLALPLLAVLTLGASGCASLARTAFRTPTVELRDIRVRGLGLEGGSLDLVLDVFNPNDYRMDATRLTYALSTDSGTVASGAVTKRVMLEKSQRSEVTLPVNFTMKELMGMAQIMLRKGTVEYIVKGDVTVDSPFGSMTRPYQAKARIDNASLIPR